MRFFHNHAVNPTSALTRVLVLSCFLVGCATVEIPVQEYTLARSALEFAEINDSERLAPLPFQQAQQLYQRGVQMYEKRDYDEARRYFTRSRKLAEKAETTSRIKKAKSGEVL